jgi:hypothetical protein
MRRKLSLSLEVEDVRLGRSLGDRRRDSRWSRRRNRDIGDVGFVLGSRSHGPSSKSSERAGVAVG